VAVAYFKEIPGNQCSYQAVRVRGSAVAVARKFELTKIKFNKEKNVKLSLCLTN
jgi:hypothetical protein